MQAIVQQRFGSPADVLAPSEVEPQQPGPDEVLIRVAASSVNAADWF